MEINEQDRRDKVIKELECCVSLNHNGSKCANCDYADEFHNGDCETYLLRDALALLKAQEPVEPKKVNRYIDFDGEGHPYNPERYDCGACGKELPWKASYCPVCGRKVKWDE